MHRRTLDFFGPLALYATVCHAAAWALITKEEFDQSLAATQPLTRSTRLSSESRWRADY